MNSGPVDGEGIEQLFKEFDLTTNSDGFMVDKDGNTVTATDGEPIQKNNIGFSGKEDGEPVFVRDNIDAINQYLQGEH